MLRLTTQDDLCRDDEDLPFVPGARLRAGSSRAGG